MDETKQPGGMVTATRCSLVRRPKEEDEDGDGLIHQRTAPAVPPGPWMVTAAGERARLHGQPGPHARQDVQQQAVWQLAQPVDAVGAAALARVHGDRSYYY